MKFRIVYPLYIWLVGITLGTFIYYWSYVVFVSDTPLTWKVFTEALSGFPFSIFIMLTISFPGYLLLWLISYLISNIKALSTLAVKGWVAFTSVLLCGLTFIYFGALKDPEELMMSTCFAIPLFGCAYFFKLRGDASGGL